MAAAKYPEVVVGLFIRNASGQILLVRSYKWPGKWVVMGGHIEFGESISAACAREAIEELSLGVTFKHVIEVVEFIDNPEFHEKGRHLVGLQSECFTKSDKFTIDNDEIQEAKWFSLEEALKLNVLDVTRKTIKKLAGRG